MAGQGAVGDLGGEASFVEPVGERAERGAQMRAEAMPAHPPDRVRIPGAAAAATGGRVTRHSGGGALGGVALIAPGPDACAASGLPS